MRSPLPPIQTFRSLRRQLKYRAAAGIGFLERHLTRAESTFVGRTIQFAVHFGQTRRRIRTVGISHERVQHRFTARRRQRIRHAATNLKCAVERTLSAATPSGRTVKHAVDNDRGTAGILSARGGVETQEHVLDTFRRKTVRGAAPSIQRARFLPSQQCRAVQYTVRRVHAADGKPPVTLSWALKAVDNFFLAGRRNAVDGSAAAVSVAE